MVPAIAGGVAGAIALAAGVWWFLLPPPQESPHSAAAASPPAAAPEASSAPDPAGERAATAPGDAAGPAEPAAPPDAAAPGGNEMAAAPVAPAPESASSGPSFSRLLVLDALKGALADERQWRAEALALAFRSGRWADYQSLLARAIQEWAGSRRLTAADVFGNPFGREAVLRHAFLAAAGDVRELVRDSATRDFTRWLLENPDALESLLLAAAPDDDLGKAVRVWADIAGEDDEARVAWRELAVACAVVFDRRVYARNPDGELEGIDPWVRYAYFKTNAESGRLTGRIRQMTASDLIWCVGVPVVQSELEWALEKVNFRQRNWGAAYGSIEYDMQKAVEGTQKKPYLRYTFEEIEKKGGVCGDQAYFAAWTACAHGIPATILSGDGARGPHAWIAWLADRGEWQFAGRFSGYPAGECRNPQTGRGMSEEEFVRLNDRKASSPERIRNAKRCLWLAEVFRDRPELAGEFIDAAAKHAPRMVSPFAARLEFWTRNRADATVDEWKGLLDSIRKSFRDCEPLMDAVVRAEEQFVFARQDPKRNLRDMRREADRTGRTAAASRGIDPSLDRLAAAFRRQAKLLADQKDLDGICSLYRRALMDHADDAAAFKALGRDFFESVKDSPDHAAKACRELENICRRSVGRSTGDWFDVTSRNSAWNLVADCYAKAGNDRKAAEIRRETESAEKSARRRQI